MSNLNISNVIKVLKINKSRPILRCLHINKDEKAFTNSYVLGILEDKSSIENPININLFNGNLDGGSYPNYNDLVNGFKGSLGNIKEIKYLAREHGEMVYQVTSNNAKEGHFLVKSVNDMIKCFTVESKRYNYKRLEDIPLEYIGINESGTMLLIKYLDITMIILGLRI